MNLDNAKAALERNSAFLYAEGFLQIITATGANTLNKLSPKITSSKSLTYFSPALVTVYFFNFDVT